MTGWGDDDHGLAHRAARGEQAAFALLVRRHERVVRGFLRRLCAGSALDSEDLAQECFLRAWRKAATFGARGSYRAWLLGIAWRGFLAAARANRRRGEVEAIEPGPSDPDLVPVLRDALARLDPVERAAVTLCLGLGHSHGEAAAILALPLGTLKSRVARGRERLQSLLGDLT